MKRGTLRMYGPVGMDLFGDGTAITARGVAADLDRLRADGVTALDVYLSSDGGDVGEGLAIYAQLQRFPGDVTIHVDGRALSIASAIALAGNRLVMPKSSLMMIHGPWRATIGNEAEHDRAKSMLSTMAETMRGIYSGASGMSPERAQKIMDEETWLSADDAKALGFADEVTATAQPMRAAAASHSPLLDVYRNTPAALRGMRAEAALAKLEGLLMRQRMEETARGASAAAVGLSPGAKNTK